MCKLMLDINLKIICNNNSDNNNEKNYDFIETVFYLIFSTPIFPKIFENVLFKMLYKFLF